MDEDGEVAVVQYLDGWRLNEVSLRGGGNCKIRSCNGSERCCRTLANQTIWLYKRSESNAVQFVKWNFDTQQQSFIAIHPVTPASRSTKTYHALSKWRQGQPIAIPAMHSSLARSPRNPLKQPQKSSGEGIGYPRIMEKEKKTTNPHPPTLLTPPHTSPQAHQTHAPASSSSHP